MPLSDLYYLLYDLTNKCIQPERERVKEKKTLQAPNMFLHFGPFLYPPTLKPVIIVPRVTFWFLKFDSPPLGDLF